MADTYEVNVLIRQSDWELLEYLYKTKSITKTAAALYMTQPAVTKRLQYIEEEFGVVIAQRGTGGLTFTSKDAYLSEYASRMLREYREMKALMQEQTEKIYGTLHIAASGSMARFLLPGLLGQFKKKYPEVEFEVSSDFSYKVSQMVTTRKTQVGFIRGEHLISCEKLLIRSQPACVACARPFLLEDLPEMPRIDFYSDQSASTIIDTWWYENFSQPPKIAMTVQSGSTCCEMVKNGLGYAIFLSQDFLQGAPELYRIPLYDRKNAPVTRNDWMIYRRESLELDISRSFLEFSCRYFRENFS